ncbi:phage protein GemA/Gp16 family protein [Inquilinus sp. CA228]|uniref:phage protein GemA/Gp16 family protein n=1 Tax=Inquilinus sp. CA228 TaxID=3455609 RepID=UPI003F8D4588
MTLRLATDNPQQTKAKQLRRTELGLIHKGAKTLALTEDSYRDLLRGQTGKESSGDMTGAERRRVIDRLRELGALEERQAYKASLGGGQAGMARGLWAELRQLGALEDASDEALDAFVRRQTKDQVTACRFLQDPRQARPVIEALKGWIARVQGRS